MHGAGAQVAQLSLRVDARDSLGCTPLHSAATSGHASAIRKLLQLSHGVDVTDELGAAWSLGLRVYGLMLGVCDEWSVCFRAYLMCLGAYRPSACRQGQPCCPTQRIASLANGLGLMGASAALPGQ